MIKKILKATLKGILGIILIIGVLYAGFHLWEYSTGGKYVDYLKENSETVPLSEAFSFEILDKDIEDNRLVLVGEIHGFEEPQKFDYELFTHLNAEHGVKQYYAELDFVQAMLLNQYLESGEEELLEDILKNWAVVQGRSNKDYYDKYRKFHEYYKQVNANDKFIFIGIDKIQDLGLTSKFLSSLNTFSTEAAADGAPNPEVVLEQISVLDSIFINSPDTLFILSHIKKNLIYSSEDMNREEVMFENFRAMYKRFDDGKNIAYGYFGLYHVFQYQVNGKQPLASQIRTADLGLENKILSMNFLMVDSYMVMPSNQLPDFMRDAGSYTRMPISSDVMLFMYIYGIKDFKRMTPENHKSLVKMNSKNSPYGTTSRMSKTIQILPVADKFEFNEKGKPYAQYTVFVRNSDWAEPAE